MRWERVGTPCEAADDCCRNNVVATPPHECAQTHIVKATMNVLVAAPPH